MVFFTISEAKAQTDQIDSLTRLLNRSQGEEYFIRANDLAEIYLENNALRAGQISEELLTSENLEVFPSEHARALYGKARALSIQGQYETSYEYFDRAIVLFDSLSDKNNLANCYLGKGATYAYNGRYRESRELLERSLEMYTETENEAGRAKAFHELGHLEYFLRNYAESLDHYRKSIEIHKALGDRKGLSKDYFRIGITYHLNKEEGNALENFTKSRAIKEAIGDMTGLARVNISLANLHEEKGNYKTALGYLRQSLEANSTFGDLRISSVIFNNMGILYEDWGKYDSAVVYHKKALDIRRTLGKEWDIVQSLMNIGEANRLQNDLEGALRSYQEAFRTSNATAERPMMSYINDKMGATYLGSGKLDSAEHYLNKALELRQQEGDHHHMFKDTYSNLSALAERQGDYKRALEYYKLFKEVQDSIFQSGKNRELAEVQAKYDTARQEREISTLQQENKARTLWRNIFAIGTVLTLGIVLLLFQFFMYRNRKNKELLAIEEEQRRQLEEVDRLKSRFFNNISHEFRTPLTLILGPLDKIRKTADTTLLSAVEVIERNGKRLLKLINQLLDLSKIESGKVTLKASLTDVVPLIKGWAMSFSSLAETKGIELSFHTDKAAHFLYVDQGKIEEVVINLLSNALKYTPDGGTVSIRLKEKKEGQRHVLGLAVTDTGTGIPEQELEHIFDRFYQASNADREDVTGTGIGLALIKELVALHKGKVRVQSKVGVGSTFEVELPFGKAHLSDDDLVLMDRSMETPAPLDTGNTVKVVQELSAPDGDDDLPIALLIEDNQDLRNYIGEILAPSYRVLEAVNGEKGLDLAFEHVPDIVLSDLMMPKMDGMEVCKRLKNDMRTSHIPIILLTAKASKEDKIEGLKNLADDYLTKPFDTEELLVRLENLVSLRKKMQQHFHSGDQLMPKKIPLNSMDQVFMEKVATELEDQIANPLFGVIELAYAMALSRSQLFRKIKAITDMTPNEFIRSFRLYRALDMVRQKSGTITQIAYAVGFQNPSYFSKCFQEQFGKSPSEMAKG